MSVRVIALLLVLATFLVFLPATNNGFVNYDDNDYVTENAVVQEGLTAAGFNWAFACCHVSNWHPLTWLSHMADCQLFHLNPAGHHFTSILIHATTACLLFLWLRRFTGSIWTAAFIAALFAWHPLRVESVAWVAERKDVLCGFFGLLALISYTRYAQHGRRSAYFLALLFLILGLMSKPMLVTFPFVLLLLDYWPLKRMQKTNLHLLLLEKLPFFLLIIASCAMTFLAQKEQAVASLQKVPLELRLANAVVSYVEYLLKLFWPVNLAVFYPLPERISWTGATSSAGLLVVISGLACWQIRRRPYLAVGWFWFLGTLVPVIGIVQVGDQALADRYTYFPLIGLLIALTFVAVELAGKFHISKTTLTASAVLILAACLALTEKQVGYWRDSQTLFTHALSVTRDNALAHLNLGVALQELRQPDLAIVEYHKALQLDPNRCEVYNNIARILNDKGKPAEALEYCRSAAGLNPKSPAVHDRLGIILTELGRYDEATSELSEAIRLDANYAQAQFQMGRTLLKMGRNVEAVSHLRIALKIEPHNLQMLIYTARVLASNEAPGVRNGTEALSLARAAASLAGKPSPIVLDTLAMASAEAGHFDEATVFAQQAINLTKSVGVEEDVAEMQHRLDLYQRNQPWRETFQSK
jgi:tetratricopeptide (TPR) repeat protein